MSRVFKRATLSALITGLLLQPSLASEEVPGFAQDYQPEGWYFYVDPDEKIEPVFEQEKVAPKPEEKTEEKAEEEEPKKEVKITSAWLRENLPLLLDEAQDYPTYENVRRYIYAQRIALDRATLFSTLYGQVSQREEALNETLRRPTAGNQLLVMNEEIDKHKKKLVADNYDNFGIFFYMSSSCSYCAAMLKELDIIKRKFKTIDILPVSIDGMPIPNRPDWATQTVYDDGTLTEIMPVRVTPTFYLMNKQTGQAAMMVNGYINATKFESLMFDVMRVTEVITETEYQTAKQVKDILLVPNGDESPLMVDEEELYENPDYLADKLRKIFNEKYMGPDREFDIPGTVPDSK